MKIIAAMTAPAACQPRRRNRARMAKAPGRKCANTTTSNNCMDGEGTSQPNSSMVGVKRRACGSATDGWPLK